MTNFRCEVGVVKRAVGRSVVAAASYRSGTRMTDPRTGIIHDYSRKSAVPFAAIIAPKNAPAWALDREQLWGAVEQVEKRRDAQLARDFTLTLPDGLPLAARIRAAQRFADEQLVQRGMVADIALHEPETTNPNANLSHNDHVHVLATLRAIGEDGRFGKKERGWNDRALVEKWREAWASILNDELARLDDERRLDHRSRAARAKAARERQKKAVKAGDKAAALRAKIEAVTLEQSPLPYLNRALYQAMREGDWPDAWDIEIRLRLEAEAKRSKGEKELAELRADLAELEAAPEAPEAAPAAPEAPEAAPAAPEAPEAAPAAPEAPEAAPAPVEAPETPQVAPDAALVPVAPEAERQVMSMKSAEVVVGGYLNAGLEVPDYGPELGSEMRAVSQWQRGDGTELRARVGLFERTVRFILSVAQKLLKKADEPAQLPPPRDDRDAGPSL